DGQGHSRQQQSGAGGIAMQDALQQERQEEQRAEQDGVRQQARDNARGKDPVPQQLDVDQGEGRPALDPDEQRKRKGRADDANPQCQARPAPGAAERQRQEQQGDGRGEGHGATPVEALGGVGVEPRAGLRTGQDQPCGYGAGDAKRHGDEKHPLPTKGGDEKASDRWSDRKPNGLRGTLDSDGSSELAARDGGSDDGYAVGLQHG